MGFVCEYIHPQNNKVKVTIIWNESNVVDSAHKENVIKNNVSLSEFKDIVVQYEKRYGKYGFHWTTILNNESRAFGLEYSDRGFNN